MEEGQCTAEGITRKVPAPFLVIATQNPLGNLPVGNREVQKSRGWRRLAFRYLKRYG